MAFTHVDIVEHKKRSLAYLFLALVLVYTFSIVTIIWGVCFFSDLKQPRFETYLYVFAIAITLTFLHWLASVSGMFRSAVTALNAQPIDLKDAYHRRFQNIVDEVSVATGNRYRINAFVINSAAVNACGFSDLNYNAAIVVTEGFLARLTRQQMEAAIGHLAGHIVSGDCVVTSVFTALFAFHEEALQRVSDMFDGESEFTLRARGRIPFVLIFVVFILWLSNAVRKLCGVFVSRAFIFRADALAVKLTRNPQALAEALRIMSRHWRGYGSRGGNLSALFIMDSGAEAAYSERNDWLANWCSAHPPVQDRIALLLQLAGMSTAEIDGWDVQARRAKTLKPQYLPEPVAEPLHTLWSVNSEGRWSEPMKLPELLALPGFGPETWVRPNGVAHAQPAFQDPQIMDSIKKKFGQSEDASRLQCPLCRIGLSPKIYEGVTVQECPHCGGCYAKTTQVTRILAREEYSFSEAILRSAEAIGNAENASRIKKSYEQSGGRAQFEAQCPECGSRMSRKFYTEAYLVEVEQCWICGLTWFDRDELEILQCLYEKRKNSQPGGAL